jgi:hypothetical protein
MAVGGNVGLIQGISMYTEGGHCLVPPWSQNRCLLLTRDSPLPGPCDEYLLPTGPKPPLGAPFRGCGGAESGPESRKFIFPGGEFWGRISGCRYSRQPRFARRMTALPCCFRRQQRPVLRGLDLSWKPDASRQPSSNANVISNLLEGSDIRTIWKN